MYTHNSSSNFYKLKILWTIILSIIYSGAYSQEFEWAVAMCGEDSWDKGESIHADHEGNVYITGEFDRIVDFDPSENEYNLNALENGKSFIVKLDKNGQLIWAKNIQVFNYTKSISTLDSDDNILITGYFSYKAEFNTETDTISYTSAGNLDIFVAKLDKNGHLLWSKHFGGAESAYPEKITTDKENNIYIGGCFKDTLNFYTDTYIAPINSNSTYLCNIFLIKLNSDGVIQWVKNIGGSNDDRLKDLSIDTNNNLYFTGYIYEDCDFDDSNNEYILSTEDKNAYVCKYNASGNFEWAKLFKNSDNNDEYGVSAGHTIDVDNYGNVYTCGSLLGTIDFDPGEESFNLTSDQQNQEIYISKLDTNGNFIWAGHINVDITDNFVQLKLDTNNHIFLYGTFYGAYDFDPNENSIFALNSPHGYNFFLCHLDSDGTFIRAQQMGSSYTSEALGLSIDQQNNIYLTGYFSNTADFNPDPYEEFLIDGSIDIFAVKLTSEQNISKLEFQNQENINLYPNPVTNNLIIQSNKIITHINIYNEKFQKIKEYSPYNTLIYSNISSLNPGMYFCEIITDKQIKYIKFIKN